MRERLIRALRFEGGKRKIPVIAMLICLFGMVFGLTAFAADYTMNIHGSYRHPRTGVIEDSGGEASEALGQSMVQRIMGEKAYYEEVGEDHFLSVTFGLSNSISSFQFDVETGNGFAETSCERFFDGDNIAGYRIRTLSKETVLRARFFVEPMGRNVVFYLYGTDFVPGNGTSFPSLTSHTEEPPQAQQPAAPPAASETASLGEAYAETGAAAPAGTSLPNPAETFSSQAVTPFLPDSADALLETAEGIIMGSGSAQTQDGSVGTQGDGAKSGSRITPEDGFLGTVFLFVLAANLLSGLLLIAFYFSVRFLYDSRNEKKRRLEESLKRDSILDLDGAYAEEFGMEEEDGFEDLDELRDRKDTEAFLSDAEEGGAENGAPSRKR